MSTTQELPYKPVEEWCTADYIFRRKFHCRVQERHTRSMDNLRFHGVVDSGDPVRNAQMSRERVDRMLTIVDMKKYYDEGVTVGVVKVEDTKLIYEYISNHLNYWKGIITTSVAPPHPQLLTDLIALDKLAKVVYAHARHQFTTEFVESILARGISGVMRHDPSQLLRKPGELTKVPEKKDDDEPQYPEHESLSDLFSDFRRTVRRRPTAAPNSFGSNTPQPENSNPANSFSARWK